MMDKIKSIKNMLLFVTSLVIFVIGQTLYSYLLKKKEKKLIKDYYNEKRKLFDLKNQHNNKRIDELPIEQLLKDEEYLQRKSGKTRSRT